MRTVGIIAEYDPFHTGHAYHIKKAKEISGADYAVVVMSPDFVQRGEPAVFDKYTRAHMALQNGADLVLELPVCYATGSAEYFALGAVTLFERLGVSDALCFGAENADVGLFSRIAGILVKEPEEYTAFLRRSLRQGDSFPLARAKALAHFTEAKDAPALSDFLASPNNILGIEYCKILQKTGSGIRPIPIRRESAPYHSTVPHGAYCSASAIRKKIAEAAVTDAVVRYIPENCRDLFSDACKHTVTSEELLPFLTQKLLAYNRFDSFFDISPELSDRIRAQRYACIGKSYRQIVAVLKSRQITEARIRRALLHLILDIHLEDVMSFTDHGTAAYLKVLGLRRDASPLLHSIKEVCALPFLTKPAAGANLKDDTAARMWRQDLFASHLYRSIRCRRFGEAFRTEYEISPIVI